MISERFQRPRQAFIDPVGGKRTNFGKLVGHKVWDHGIRACKLSPKITILISLLFFHLGMSALDVTSGLTLAWYWFWREAAQTRDWQWINHSGLLRRSEGTNLRQWVQSKKWSNSENKPCWKHHHAAESTSLRGSEEYSMNWPIVLTLTCLRKLHVILMDGSGYQQGCINCAILLSGIGARGVSSEHMENINVFLFSNIQLRCALILRELNQIFIACLF